MDQLPAEPQTAICGFIEDIKDPNNLRLAGSKALVQAGVPFMSRRMNLALNPASLRALHEAAEHATLG